jgi:membrane protein required for colicin V production
MTLTPFDWILAAILIYSTILAFMRGILREIFAIGGLIAGILLASWNYRQVAILLRHVINTQATAEIVAFLLILVAIMLLAALLGRALHRTANAVGLGFFHRLSSSIRLGCTFLINSLFPCWGTCCILRCTSGATATDS